MKDAGELAEPPGPLPPAMAAALAAFQRHLRSERSLSPHTVRAYVGDVSSLLEHAASHGVEAPEGLGLTELRGWLAVQHESGAARATLARRGAAARSFTAFAYRQGWLATDPGARLGTLKARRTLPHVLSQDEMAALLAGLDQAGRQAEAELSHPAKAELSPPAGAAEAAEPQPSRNRSRGRPTRRRCARVVLRDRDPGQRAVRAGSCPSRSWPPDRPGQGQG